MSLTLLKVLDLFCPQYRCQQETVFSVRPMILSYFFIHSHLTVSQQRGL